MTQTAPLAITELVLRDAHQSLLATRLRIEDMLPIAEKLDRVGFWSLETWGGATFDACIRYLGEDPRERLRRLKAAMPRTRHQMLLRGQNLLGYRHYADDVWCQLSWPVSDNYLGRLAPLFFRGRVSYVLVWEGCPWWGRAREK